MRSESTKFIIAVVVLTALCAGVEVFLNQKLPVEKQMGGAFLMLGLFAGIVVLAHLFLLKSAAATPNGFVRAFMLGSTLKFFAYLTILIAFLLYATDNRQVMIIHFLFYYAAFTVLEVSMLQQAIKKK